MGNTETKGQDGNNLVIEDSKLSNRYESSEALKQIDDGQINSYRYIKEKSDARRANRSNRTSVNSKKKGQSTENARSLMASNQAQKNRFKSGLVNIQATEHPPSLSGPVQRIPISTSRYDSALRNGSNRPITARARYSVFQTNQEARISHTIDHSASPTKYTDSGLTEHYKNLRKNLISKKRRAEQLKKNLNGSNSELLNIRTVLSSEALTNRDPNFVLYEGGLLKYKPGTSFNWVERWCRVTNTHFMYYKNQWTASCWDLKPLLIVPISEVVAVFRVNLDLPENKESKSAQKSLSSSERKYKELFQFEIFSELSEYPYKDEVAEDENMNNLTAEERDKKTHDEEEKKIAQQINVTGLQGFKLWDEYQERKQRDSPAKARREGYLMRPPLTYKTYRKTRENVLKSKENLNRELLHYAYGLSQESARTQNGRDEDRHFSPPRKTQPSEHRESPSRKGAAYKWVKDATDLTSWSGREREWFYSEKRLLFATPVQQEREIWVGMLNWLFDKMVKEAYDSKANIEY